MDRLKRRLRGGTASSSLEAPSAAVIMVEGAAWSSQSCLGGLRTQYPISGTRTHLLYVRRTGAVGERGQQSNLAAPRQPCGPVGRINSTSAVTEVSGHSGHD